MSVGLPGHGRRPSVGDAVGEVLATRHVEHVQGRALVAPGRDAVGEHPAVGRGMEPVDGRRRVAGGAVRVDQRPGPTRSGRRPHDQHRLVELTPPFEGEHAAAADTRRDRGAGLETVQETGPQLVAAGQARQCGVGAAVLGRHPRLDLGVAVGLEPAEGVGDRRARGGPRRCRPGESGVRERVRSSATRVGLAAVVGRLALGVGPALRGLLRHRGAMLPGRRGIRPIRPGRRQPWCSRSDRARSRGERPCRSRTPATPAGRWRGHRCRSRPGTPSRGPWSAARREGPGVQDGS